MGNCALKPKVLSETGAPAPEELKDSLLEDHKIEAAKSLSNLFLQVSRYKHKHIMLIIFGMLLFIVIYRFVVFGLIGQGRQENERRRKDNVGKDSGN